MTADTDIEINFGKPIPKAEPGTYPSICMGLAPFQINEGTAEAKTLIRWDFSLDGTEDPEQPGMTVILDGVTSTATGPRSKMRPWVVALTGRNPDERLKLSELAAQVTGRPCLVQVEINDAGYSKAANVLPPMRQPARPASAVPTMPAPLLREEPPVDQPLTTLPNMDPGPTEPEMDFGK